MSEAMNSGSKSDDSGFTLVEILIALFIFALISAATMTALSEALRGKTQLTERLNQQAELATVLTLLRTDFSNRVYRPLRDEYGLAVDDSRIPTDLLTTFLRSGRTNPQGLEPRSELQRVAYLFDNSQFIRRIWASANPAQHTPTHDRVLLTGLKEVEFVTSDISGGFFPGLSSTPESNSPINRLSSQVTYFIFTFQNGDRLRYAIEQAL